MRNRRGGVLPGATAWDFRDFRIHHRAPCRADSAPTAVSGSGAAAQVRQHAGPALHAVSHFDLQLGGGIQQDIHSRPKFDQADAFSPLYRIANFLGEHDPARQQSCDLLEHYRLPVALNRDRILLVVLGRRRVHGVQKLSFLIANFADDAGHRRAVHMHIEHAEKNADPGARDAFHQNGRHVGDLAVAG